MAVDIPALLAELTEIVGDYRSAQAKAAAADDNFRCEECVKCHSCRFCNGCRDCDECTYCEACVGCEKCTRCKSCESCREGNQLEHCRGCERSQHLLLCLDCSESSHCIACVGLVGEEHCILNRRYDRKDYFRLAKALKKHLEKEGADGIFEASAAPAKDTPESDTAAASGFIVDGLRRVRGKVQGNPAPIGGEDDPAADEELSPWLDEARAQVDRVEEAPTPAPPAYGVITWNGA